MIFYWYTIGRKHTGKQNYNFSGYKSKLNFKEIQTGNQTIYCMYQLTIYYYSYYSTTFHEVTTFITPPLSLYKYALKSSISKLDHLAVALYAVILRLEA